MTPREGLDFAVRMFGSQKALGNAIDFTQDAVKEALKRGRPTPLMAKNIEVVTTRLVKRGKLREGQQITRLMLLPEVFGDSNRLVKNSWSRHLRSRRRR